MRTVYTIQLLAGLLGCVITVIVCTFWISSDARVVVAGLAGACISFCLILLHDLWRT